MAPNVPQTWTVLLLPRSGDPGLDDQRANSRLPSLRAPREPGVKGGRGGGGSASPRANFHFLIIINVC